MNSIRKKEIEHTTLAVQKTHCLEPNEQILSRFSIY